MKCRPTKKVRHTATLALVLWYLLVPLQRGQVSCTPNGTDCTVFAIATNQQDCVLARVRLLNLAEHPELWPPPLIALAGGTPLGIKEMQDTYRAAQCIGARPPS